MSARPQSTALGITAVTGFLVVMEFASGVLQGWLSPLLPSILLHYSITAADLNWVNATYLLSTAVCVPLMSKLGDRYGHRRLLIISAALVAIGSVLVAVAPSFGILLLGRAVQGPLGAFLPLEFAIVRERGGDRAGRAVGLLVGALAVGGSVGLLLGGVVRQNFSLSLTLWIPAIVMIVAVLGATLFVPETTVRKQGRIDWVGAALLGLGLVLLLTAVGRGSIWGWMDPRTTGGIVIGLVVLAAWVRIEQHVPAPFIDLSLLRRDGLRAPVAAGFFYGAQLYGSQAVVAIFLGSPASSGYGFGLMAFRLSLVLLVFGVAAFVGTAVASRLVELAGRRATLILGSVVTAAGFLLTAVAHDSIGLFMIWQALVGVGNGLLLATLAAQVVTRAPADEVGISSGLFNTSRTVGGAVAGAAFVAIMAGMLTKPVGVRLPMTSEAGFVVVWLVCGGLALAVGAIAALSGDDETAPLDDILAGSDGEGDSEGRAFARGARQ